jgi:ribosomal-protein-alanine N-acetyltransferase
MAPVEHTAAGAAPGDADAYVRFSGDSRTPEELWPSDLRTPDHARATLEGFIEHRQRWGFGVWTVLLPGSEVIGHAGAQHTTIDGRPEVELLWFIHPDYWNRGYATEIATRRCAWPSTCSGSTT